MSTANSFRLDNPITTEYVLNNSRQQPQQTSGSDLLSRIKSATPEELQNLSRILEDLNPMNSSVDRVRNFLA